MTASVSWPAPSHASSDEGIAVSAALKEDSHRIFRAKAPVDVDAAIVNEKGLRVTTLESEDAVIDYFNVRCTGPQPYFSTKRPQDDANKQQDQKSLHAFFCFFTPAYGWSELLITLRGFQTIVGTLNVFPAFFRYVQLFGVVDHPKDEGFGGFDSSVVLDATSAPSELELCYQIKYAEKKQDFKPGGNPWALRQSVIYQKSDFVQNKRDHILIRLSEQMHKRLGRTLQSGTAQALGFAEDWTSIHLLCWRALDDGWRGYINYLDEEVYKIYLRVVMSEVTPARLKLIDTAENALKDMKNLQILTDQTIRTIHTIDVNMNIIDCLTKKLEEMSIQNITPAARTSMADMRVQLQKIRQEHMFHQKHASSVIDRAKLLSDQLRDTVSLRNSELNRLSTELGNKNLEAMRQLADRTGQETHVVKVVTILALVFIPATFAAEFLQMNYVQVEEGTKFTLTASPGLKIYAMLAIPLIALVMLVYGVVELRKRALTASSRTK